MQGCCPGIGLLSLRGKFGPQVDISYQMNRHVMRHGTGYIVTDVHLLLAPVMTDTRSLGLEPKHKQQTEFWNRSISNGEQRPGFGLPGLPGLCQAHCKPMRSAQPRNSAIQDNNCLQRHRMNQLLDATLNAAVFLGNRHKGAHAVPVSGLSMPCICSF